MSVLAYLQQTADELLLGPRERESIARSTAALESRLDDYFPAGTFKETFSFGSSTRGTALPRRADENSDVDYMLVFADGGAVKPQTYMDRLKRFANESYPTTEIFQSRPTVVLNLSRRKFELVPGHRGGFWRSLQIPAPASDFTQWTSTDPQGFSNRLEAKDKYNSGEIKPLIRLLKYWNAVNGTIYPSYALEQTVVEHDFWFWIDNLRDRLFSVIGSLPTSDLSQKAMVRVDHAQRIATRVRDLENRDYDDYAEQEVMKLIPEL